MRLSLLRPEDKDKEEATVKPNFLEKSEKRQILSYPHLCAAYQTNPVITTPIITYTATDILSPLDKHDRRSWHFYTNWSPKMKNVSMKINV